MPVAAVRRSSRLELRWEPDGPRCALEPGERECRAARGWAWGRESSR
jgi:hypothetical protein